MGTGTLEDRKNMKSQLAEKKKIKREKSVVWKERERSRNQVRVMND